MNTYMCNKKNFGTYTCWMFVNVIAIDKKSFSFHIREYINVLINADVYNAEGLRIELTFITPLDSESSKAVCPSFHIRYFYVFLCPAYIQIVTFAIFERNLSH